MKIASGNDKLEAADFAAVVTLNDLKKTNRDRFIAILKR